MPAEESTHYSNDTRAQLSAVSVFMARYNGEHVGRSHQTVEVAIMPESNFRDAAKSAVGSPMRPVQNPDQVTCR